MTRSRVIATGQLTVLVFLLGYSAAADAYGSLRCKGKFIRPGISAAQVLSLCGEPRSRIVEEVPVRSRNIAGFTWQSGVSVTERWEYKRGWGKFPVVLTFREGELRRVDYLRYRSGKR